MCEIAKRRPHEGGKLRPGRLKRLASLEWSENRLSTQKSGDAE